MAALRDLRPDPSVTQIEELQSRGNSYYHGVSFEAQRRLSQRGFLRASYTLSKLIDDGVVNTSSPLVVGDFRRERALSLQDARHRVAISGACLFPAWLARLNLSGTFNYGSSSPFSIGVRGNDRNLDDVTAVFIWINSHGDTETQRGKNRRSLRQPFPRIFHSLSVSVSPWLRG